VRAMFGVVIAVALGLGCASGGDDVGMQGGPVGVLPPTAGIGGTGTGFAGVSGGGAGSSLAGNSGSSGMGGAGANGGTGGISGSSGIGGMGAGMGGNAGMTGGAGSMSTAGSGGMPSIGDAEPRIPPKPASCPEIATGDIMVKGQSVKLYVGPAGMPGPMVFYWHGTGSRPEEAEGGLGPGLSEIMSQGGVVASFTTTTMSGMNTGNNVWYTGDFEMADEIFACAYDQGLVDPRQVYTAGCSAGGLQASAMVYGRSSYLAAAMPNSGGTVFRYTLEDEHVPAVMAAHGAQGTDVVIIDFADTTATQCSDIASKGGFMLDCDHGGRHCGSPSDLKAAQWKFLKDHPFGVDPEPYRPTPPANVPSFCAVCE
jgi:hypothetical protein